MIILNIITRNIENDTLSEIIDKNLTIRDHDPSKNIIKFHIRSIMRRIIAFLLAIAFVFPLVLAAQALGSVNTFILDRGFYIDTLESDQVYNSLLSDSSIRKVLGDYIPLSADADLSQVAEVLKSVISHDYLKIQTTVIVNGFFDFIQGKTESFAPVIDLLPVKSMLAEEKLDEMLQAIAAILPVCEPGQVPGIDFKEQKACKPAGLNDFVLSQDYLKPVFPLILGMIPNEIPVGEKWDEIRLTRNWGPFISGMALPASLMLITIFLAFLAASCWYITALISDESWRIRLLWLGWMLIIPSALVFIIGLVVITDIPAYWINLGLQNLNMNGIPLGIGMQESLRAVISGSLSRIANSFMIVGGVSSAIGLGFIFWGLATSKKVA